MAAEEHYEVREGPSTGVPYQIHAPDGSAIAAVTDYLQELVATDCSRATIKAYAYALLDWFRFLSTAGTVWHDPGVSLVHVQAHLRHKHITTTERYLHARPEDVVRSVQAHYDTDRRRTGEPATGGGSAGWHYDDDDLRLLLGGDGEHV